MIKKTFVCAMLFFAKTLVLVSSTPRSSTPTKSHFNFDKAGVNYISGTWTAKENGEVLKLYEQFKGSSNIWENISIILNRKPRQIRHRYVTKLDPLQDWRLDC